MHKLQDVFLLDIDKMLTQTKHSLDTKRRSMRFIEDLEEKRLTSRYKKMYTGCEPLSFPVGEADVKFGCISINEIYSH